jgi:hypothetical protein
VVLSLSSHPKGVYNPKAVIPHAALLPQALAHWGKFLAAASRRSLGRVSVPVCLVVLSDQEPVTGLVRHYHTNYLMGRRLIPERVTAFLLRAYAGLAPLSRSYPPLRGRSPTCSSAVRHAAVQAPCVRLACIRHAASVHPEPGSNSALLTEARPKPTPACGREPTCYCDLVVKVHVERTIRQKQNQDSSGSLSLLATSLKLTFSAVRGCFDLTCLVYIAFASEAVVHSSPRSIAPRWVLVKSIPRRGI